MSTFVAHVPATAVLVTVAVTTSVESALERVEADPTRGISRERTFLTERYEWWTSEMARLDLDMLLDTSQTSVEQGVRLITHAVDLARSAPV